MDPMSILFPVLSVGGMGVVFGACLGVASEVFKVEEDPRIGQVLECLPGANCGGCGFPGCGGCASAIVAGTAPVNACPVGGAAVAEKVGAIMGVAASSAEPVAAFRKVQDVLAIKQKIIRLFRQLTIVTWLFSLQVRVQNPAPMAVWVWAAARRLVPSAQSKSLTVLQ